MELIYYMAMVMPSDPDDREIYRLECEARTIAKWAVDKRLAYLSRLRDKGQHKREAELRRILADIIEAAHG